MKKLLSVLVLSLFVFLSVNTANAVAAESCNKQATVFTDGKGNNQTKKLGGNYTAISLDKLRDNQTIKIRPVSGNYKYVTLHARYNGGYWRTIYKGPNRDFPVSQYLASYKKDKNCTHVNISVNGAHEKYEPVPCRADILVCGPGQAECSKFSAVYTNGKGDNRTKKRGGTYTAIALNELDDNKTIKIDPISGTYKYVTLHARYNGGYWKTIYKGPNKEFPVSQYLASYKQDKNCTHVNISVNGGHEKYEPVACTADIQICGAADSGCDTFASVGTDGKGNNRTKKLGGNYTAIELAKLDNSKVIKINPVSGTYKYVTLHARFNGGSWRTIYKGPNKEFPVSQYLASYKKDKNCTHVIVSVNGGHEKYEPVACNADVLICNR